MTPQKRKSAIEKLYGLIHQFIKCENKRGGNILEASKEKFSNRKFSTQNFQ